MPKAQEEWNQSPQSGNLKGGQISSVWHSPGGHGLNLRQSFRGFAPGEGEMTCTLTAVGQPQLQLGTKMSAGLASELGTRFGISFDGTKAAHWAGIKSNPRWHFVGKCGHHCHHSQPDISIIISGTTIFWASMLVTVKWDPERILQTAKKLPFFEMKSQETLTARLHYEANLRKKTSARVQLEGADERR